MNLRLDSVLRDTLNASALRDTLNAVQANALAPLYALPPAVRRRLAGAPIQIDGNTLDPDIQLLLRLDNLLPHTTKTDAATARAHFRQLCKLIPGTPAEVQRVTDLTVRGAAGQLGARLYTPRPGPTTTQPAHGPSTNAGTSSTTPPTQAGGPTALAGAGGPGGPAGSTASTGPASSAAAAGPSGPTAPAGQSTSAEAAKDAARAASAASTGRASRDGIGRGLLVFFHGGGWVVGDLDTHDAVCRSIAAEAGIRVLSVDYRLAPEAPAPTAAEDAIAAFTWAVDHAEDLGVDPNLVAVGGDSAGGNLAAVVAQQTVRRDLPHPALQVLLYPGVDLVARRPSRDLFSEGFILTEEDIIWYRDMYTPDPALRPDPIVSPLRAEDLTGLPPTYLTTAGFDPLRDEGRDYAQALQAAGNPLTHIHHPTLPHGHTNLLTLPGPTRQAHTHLTNHLRDTLS
ncbi:alpha/beta hydrolase [Kribbella sp. NPDC059898]|uniref:alpha/beta hydrolase n=1 Tax=Kribbella sp. NPDC059898 TaxID=3346995 RepID=UPI0036492E97